MHLKVKEATKNLFHKTRCVQEKINQAVFGSFEIIKESWRILKSGKIKDVSTRRKISRGRKLAYER